MNKEQLKEAVGELNLVDTVFEADGVSYIDTAVSVTQVYDLIDRLDEPEKAVIPQFVADWISQAKKWEYSISDSMGHVGSYFDTTQYDKAVYWAKKNQDVFAKAWLDGYEVEEEPLYRVSAGSIVTGFWFLCKDNNGDIVIGTNKDYYEADWDSLKLTEQEIKDYDSRYMEFAELVKVAE